MTELGPYRFGGATKRYVMKRPFDAKVAGQFTRADVLVEGVDHSGPSFEARLFANNDGANADTPLDDANGYLGKFDIFGHGFCFGDVGHCEVDERGKSPTDLRDPHPMTPADVIVVVTEPLKRLLDAGKALASITFVPIAVGAAPAAAEAAEKGDVFHYKGLRLVTYE